MLCFSPIVDGHFLPDDPAVLLDKGLVHGNVVIGETADEGNFEILINFIDKSKLRPHISAVVFDEFLHSFGFTRPLVQSVIKTFYLDNRGFDEVDKNYLDDLNKIVTDAEYVCPGNIVAELMAKAGRKVFRYRLNHALSMTFFNTTWEGVPHCTDMAYVFGSHFHKGSDITLTEEEVDMTVKVIKYWSNFAKSG